MTPEVEKFLRRAIELAVASRAGGDSPFGSLLVDANGQILAEDHNTVLSDRDVSAHPELKLARWAFRELEPAAAAATTMYTSCQPCLMCQGAIARSGLGRVVYALSSDQLGALQPRPGYASPPMEGPYLLDEARVPIDGFY